MATSVPYKRTDSKGQVADDKLSAQLKGFTKLSTSDDFVPPPDVTFSPPAKELEPIGADNLAYDNDESQSETTSFTSSTPSDPDPVPNHTPVPSAPTKPMHVSFHATNNYNDEGLDPIQEDNETTSLTGQQIKTSLTGQQVKTSLTGQPMKSLSDIGLGYEFRVTDIGTTIDLYNAEKCFNDSKRVIKAIFAFFLFCVILGCLLVSKGSVLFITSQMNKFVSFKRTGFYNETVADEVATTTSFLYEDDENVTIDCSGGFRGQCEQCGVPVCLAEYDEQCAEKETVRWIWSMFLCQCVPYFIMFLRCLWKISFKKKKAPGLQVLCTVLTVESLYTIGIYLLLYVLLPQLDATRGLFLFTGTAFLPSLLKILNRPEKEGTNKMLNILLDVFAFLGQTCALITWLLLRTNNDITIANGEKDMNAVCENINYQPTPTPPPTTESYNITTTNIATTVTGNVTEPPLPPVSYFYVQMGQLPEDVSDFILIPVILFLVSLGFWQNFVDKASPFCGILNKFRYLQAEASTKIYTVVSLWKILLSFLLIVIQHAIYSDPMSLSMLFSTRNFYDNKCGHYDYYYQKKEDVDDRGRFQSDWLEVAAVQISMGVLCFYAADLAIKGQMQEFSFTAPLVIATPSAFFLLYWACVDCFNEWDFGTSYYWNCFSGESNYEEYMTNRYAWVGFIWWLSFVVLTRYLWYPQKLERLAKLDRAFVYPVPEGIMLDQALSLIRRRNDEESLYNRDRKKKKDNERDVDDNFVEVQNEVITEIPTSSPAEYDVPLKEGYVPTLEDGQHDIPFIYMCATMWHENEKEMKQMLSSVFRVNADQCAREHAKKLFQNKSNDYYRFEAHIFFDDAYEAHKPDETTGYKANKFVKEFINTINVAASIVMNRSYVLDTPKKFITPYGGRFEWTLPIGENKLVMHLKDKQLIRNRKRWSQIMYMHRILGLGIMDQPRSRQVKKEVSENTFILALDGDIDFKADAVLLLLDLMKRNTKVAAACGRIHPIGNGPMVWYQKFEYSISHWLQKATEHVLGCVLCSPGCFSLFRASALMDDNVVQMYTTKATKPIHHVQYDQGEDRWLCTLLLQQGYRVEYSAAADAYTYAPEGFNEFYNQRRRWITSTFANILDLLKTGRVTATQNENISLIYIVYQGVLFAASVLGPATIFMLIVGAFETAFSIDPLVSFFLGLLPLTIFMILCFKAKSDTQLYYAALLSVLFAILQMLVIVGISQQMVEDGVCAPSSIFFLFVVGAFVLCAFLHPQEFFNLFHGFLYYLFIPSMYLLLIIYSLCNLHVIAWGTRETKPTQSDKDKEQDEKTKEQVDKIKQASSLELAMMKFAGKSSKSSGGIGLDCRPCCLLKCCTHDDEERQMGVSEQIKVVQTIHEISKDQDEQGDVQKKQPEKRKSNSHIIGNPDPIMEVDESTVSWIDDPDIPGHGLPSCELHPEETKFWDILIKEYLYPLDTTKEEKEKTTQGLLDLRNKAVFSFFLIDMLLMVLILGLTKSGLSIKWTCTAGGEVKTSELDPIGFAFVFIFGAVLAIQVVGMLIHRLFTFLQIISKTVICKKKAEKSLSEVKENDGNGDNENTDFSEEQVLYLVRQMQRLDVVIEPDTQTEIDEFDDNIMQLGGDFDDEFNNWDDHNAVRKMSHKPAILTNEEVNRTLKARYVALSDEVFGRRPSRFIDTNQGSDDKEQNVIRRQSVYVKTFQAMDPKRKESIKQEIDGWRSNANVSKSDRQKGQRVVNIVMDGKAMSRANWSTTTIQAPGRRKRSIFASRPSVPSVLIEED